MRIYALNDNEMEIKRDLYLQKLVASRHNSLIKVVTGMRRCGKSYLLFNLFVRFLKENFEEFKDSVLLSTGIQIGVRESRRILGEHVLTQEEMIACTKFEDSVCVCNYDIDIHNPDGAGTSHRYFGPEEYYTIPYRCLVPKDTDNLLVAGRCISATHEAQASLRIMPTCCTLGCLSNSPESIRSYFSISSSIVPVLM